MEIFIKFFIDGGSEIDMDENWTIYALYEKKKDYHFVGFMSMYKFNLSIDKYRKRIS
jgi:hypothetical protein